jgi:hypothetical protein
LLLIDDFHPGNHCVTGHSSTYQSVLSLPFDGLSYTYYHLLSLEGGFIMSLSILSSILSMLIAMMIAYGLDYWLYLQLRYSRQTGNGGIILVWEILGGLILCAVWLALGLIVKVKGHRNLAVSIIYILIGLLSFVWFPLKFIGPVLLADMAKYIFLFPTQPINFQYTGLFITALGFLTLLHPKRKLD